MAYYNPFIYNRDNSTSSDTPADLTLFKSLYGSSVSYFSRLNFIETVDNSMKILPNSENNLNVKYNLKFYLSESDLSNFLRAIEIAGAYKFLKFKDFSNLYSDMIGLAEDYSINKTSPTHSYIDVFVASYVKSPIFNWKTSSFLNVKNIGNINYSPSFSYKKFDFAYIDPLQVPSAKNFKKNKIDNFWFAKRDIPSGTAFSLNDWTRDFNYPIKLPYQISSKFEVVQLNYRNSFVQNIKTKNNSHIIKDHTIKFENITTNQCRSMLFFLEKKCGYRRFIFYYPVGDFDSGFGEPIYNKYKVFICTKWNHLFKYHDCHDIEMTITEDPDPNIYVDENSTYHLI
jgi:hypothetical protein